MLNASCDASCDGSATVVIVGDNVPFSYNWSTGATGSSVNGLCSGPSIVTITDANNCVLEQTVLVGVSESIDVQYFSSDATCGACDGQATISPSGGSGNLTTTWYDGSTGPNHQNLCAGVYGYVINDNNGCSFNGEVSIITLADQTTKWFLLTLLLVMVGVMDLFQCSKRGYTSIQLLLGSWRTNFKCTHWIICWKLLFRSSRCKWMH